LIDICRKNELFFSFYAPIFTAVGTVRNKLGDAHGRGPEIEFSPEKCHAEHLFYMTLANMKLIKQLAGL
jgi:hypothetical protein